MDNRIKWRGRVDSIHPHPVPGVRGKEGAYVEPEPDNPSPAALIFDAPCGKFQAGDEVYALLPSDFQYGWDSTEGIELHKADEEPE